MLTKNRNFYLKFYILTKHKNVDQNRNFNQESKFLSKILYFDQK